jgi:hypothetical protein
MKNTRRSSTFRAKALHREGHQLLPTTNFTTKSLCSERRSSPCIFHAVVSLSIPIFLILATTYTGTDQFKINSLLSPAVPTIKPVTDEQVFYDKFLCDKFYLPSARVYMQQIWYDNFSYDKFYLLVWTCQQVYLANSGQSHLCWPIYRRTKFVLWQFFLWQVHLFKASMLGFEQVHLS